MVSSFNGFTPKKYIRHLNSIPTGSMSVTFSRRKPFNLILMESFAEFFREFFKNTFCVVMWVCAEIYFIAYRISIVWIVKHFYIVQCMNNKYNNAVLIIIIDRKDFFKMISSCLWRPIDWRCVLWASAIKSINE